MTDDRGRVVMFPIKSYWKGPETIGGINFKANSCYEPPAKEPAKEAKD